MTDLYTILQNIIGVPSTPVQADVYFAACCAIGVVIVYGVAELFFFVGSTMTFRRR